MTGSITKLEAARSAAVLEEFLAADVVVIGAPLYNFSIPSQLKAWIDRLAVPGKTFRYTKNGPQGLAGGKRVIVASSCGGFSGPETQSRSSITKRHTCAVCSASSVSPT